MDSPAQQAIALAEIAEQHTNNGEFGLAIQCHLRAGELSLIAISTATDPQIVKTLKLMYASHARSIKEIERRVANLPSTSSNRVLTELNIEPVIKTNIHQKREIQSDIYPQNESYMLLEEQSAESYAFERFWKQVEGLVDIGAAFTTSSLAQSSFPKKIIHNAAKGSLHALNSNNQVESQFENLLTSYMIVEVESSKTIQEYDLENKHLKTTVHHLTEQVIALEKIATEHLMLQSSIIQFRKNINTGTRGKGEVGIQKTRGRVDGRIRQEMFLNQLEPPVQSRDPAGSDTFLQSNKPSIESRIDSKCFDLQLRVDLLLKENAELKFEIENGRIRWAKLKEAAKKKKDSRTSLGDIDSMMESVYYSTMTSKNDP